MKKGLIAAVMLSVGLTFQLSAAGGPATQPAASGPATDPASAPKTYMYAGQARDQKWFDQQYAKFADKFIRHSETTGQGPTVKVRVTFTDLSEWLLKNPKLPEMGNQKILFPDNCPIALSNAKTIIFKIIDESNILIFTPLPKIEQGNFEDPAKGNGIILQISGFSTAGLKTNMPFKTGKFVFCQKVSDSLTEGKINIGCVPVYRPFVPLAKEEFAELLATGQRLYEYKKTGDKITVKEVE